MIYANKYDLSTLIDGAALGQSYKIWLANYTSKTTYTGECDIIIFCFFNAVLCFLNGFLGIDSFGIVVKANF